MVELAVHSNLSSGVVVNHSYVTSKAGQVAVILINTTNRNIWICQPLLAVKCMTWSCIPGSINQCYIESGIPSRLDFNQ